MCQGLQGAKPDHETGPYQALLHEVDEASAASDELRFVAMLGQKRQGLIEVRWFEIGKRDHVIRPRKRPQSIR